MKCYPRLANPTLSVLDDPLSALEYEVSMSLFSRGEGTFSPFPPFPFPFPPVPTEHVRAKQASDSEK